MGEFWTALSEAGRLVFTLDRELGAVVLLSLQISGMSVLCASLLGLPLGAAVALYRGPGRSFAVTLLNACMGLPPVVVGLFVYLLLSRAGPLGQHGLLFTPAAMVIAQTILVTPIIAALSRQAVADLHEEYDEQLRSLDAGGPGLLLTLLWDGRFRLLTAVLAGFGRASAEVGAVLIVGGNIENVTRVMTTAIALETSKGNIELALGLGMVLVALSLGVNAAATAIHDAARRRYG